MDPNEAVFLHFTLSAIMFLQYVLGPPGLPLVPASASFPSELRPRPCAYSNADPGKGNQNVTGGMAMGGAAAAGVHEYDYEPVT